jgi:ATP-dependent RNA helicase DDX56/DBP9
VVEEFNKGVYDIIIASDEHEVLGSETVHRKKKGASTNEDEPPTQNEEAAEATQDTKDQNSDPEDISSKPTKKQKRKPSKRDKEYGISRGIDFHAVACVLNFDLPTNAISYTHRIGRTARAGRSGMALSFVIPSTLYRKHKPTSLPSTEHDEKVLMEILESEKEKGNEVKDYVFDMKQVDAFRYRMNDALRAVTAVAVREARTREIRQELLKSEKLKRHFEENPDDLRHLRHDGELRAARTQAHLRHVPEYLLPQGVGGVAKEGLTGGFVGFRKAEGEENRRRKIRALKNKKGKGRVANRGRQGDVLKTFNAKGRGKK